MKRTISKEQGERTTANPSPKEDLWESSFTHGHVKGFKQAHTADKDPAFLTKHTAVRATYEDLKSWSRGKRTEDW